MCSMLRICGYFLFLLCYFTRFVATNRVTLRCSSTGLSGIPGLEQGQSGWSYEQKEAIKRLQTRIKQIQVQLSGLSSSVPSGASSSQDASNLYKSKSYSLKGQTSFQDRNSFDSLESNQPSPPTPQVELSRHQAKQLFYPKNSNPSPLPYPDASRLQSPNTQNPQFNSFLQNDHLQLPPPARTAKYHLPSVFENFRSTSSTPFRNYPAVASSSDTSRAKTYSKNIQLFSNDVNTRMQSLSQKEKSPLPSFSQSRNSDFSSNIYSGKKPGLPANFQVQRLPQSKSPSIPSYLTKFHRNPLDNSSPQSRLSTNLHKPFENQLGNHLHLLARSQPENQPSSLSLFESRNPFHLSRQFLSRSTSRLMNQPHSEKPSQPKSKNPSLLLPQSIHEHRRVSIQSGALPAHPEVFKVPPKNQINSPHSNPTHSSVSSKPSSLHSKSKAIATSSESSAKTPSPKHQWHHVYSDHFYVKSSPKSSSHQPKMSLGPSHHLKLAESLQTNKSINSIYEAFDIGYHNQKDEQIHNSIVLGNLSQQNSLEESKQLLHCDKLRAEGFDVDGSYSIEIDGSDAQVFCEFHSDGQNWLVVQRREDGSEDFYRSWIDYERGFGNTHGEFWIGLSHLHQLTSSRIHQLVVELEDFDRNKAFAKYSVFFVGNPESFYPINIYGYTGTAGDSLSYHNRHPFSTKDRDHDSNYRANCAASNRGAWWYNSCQHSNLNGEYLHGGVVDVRGIGWYSWKRSHYSLKKSTMKIRPV